MKNIRQITLALLAVGSALSLRAAAETYTIDPVHSSVGFKIRHFVSNVPGKFSKVAGTIVVDRENPSANVVDVTIDATSINTDNGKRDDHVRSADFLDAAKFPTIKFKSTAWKKTGAETFDVTGQLTIKDVTKSVTLKVTSLGFGPGMGGMTLSGWEASTTIDKKQFNVFDPPMLDAALGDDVNIFINVEAGSKKA